jgi:hypothetical protein
LLAEALVAYQETAPEEPEPPVAEPPVSEPPVAEPPVTELPLVQPVRHAREFPDVLEVRENLPPAQRAEGSTGGSGRHRMPDWATSDREGL